MRVFMKTMNVKSAVLALLLVSLSQVAIADGFMNSVKKGLKGVEKEIASIGNAVHFDYKILRINKFAAVADIESELAIYGDQGWELVNTHMLNMNGSHTVVDYIFKRERKINKI
jgi:hypothetical protein